MESMERAASRQNAAVSNEKRAYEVPTIRTIDDIKKIVDSLSIRSNNTSKATTIHTVMSFRNKDNVPINQAVSAKVSEQSHRDMIMDGIAVIRNRRLAIDELGANSGEVLVNGKPMKSPAVINTASQLPIDKLIGNVTGGYRDGEYICWDLDGYKYKFDIFSHKLVKIKHATDE